MATKTKSKADLFREKNYTTVTVRGIDFLIRKPSMRLITKFSKYFPQVSTPDRESAEAAVGNITLADPDLIDEIFVSCIVDPKVVKSGATDENTLLVDDIDIASATTLLNAIFKEIGEASAENAPLPEPNSEKQSQP